MVDGGNKELVQFSERERLNSQMNISAYRRLTIIFGILSIVLLIFCGWLFFHYGYLYLRVQFANEQIEIFHEMHNRALQSDVEEAVDCLKSIVGYYPSGTKQESGSSLDKIVERNREQAIRDIIEYLRIKTGKDFGGNPNTWIEKLTDKSSNKPGVEYKD